MLKTFKVLYGFRFLMFISDVVVVDKLIRFKTLRSSPNYKKVFYKTPQTWVNANYGSSRYVKQQMYSIWCGGCS